jgi:hypothetical protein
MNKNPFIYNPSEQVDKSMRGISQGVQNAWQPIIQERIMGYESISRDLDNIDKLKSELGVYHRGILTDRLNTLQGEMAKSIKANGKLNGEEIAKVRDNIAQVKNLHLKSQDAGEVLKEGLSRLQASSQFINDIGGTAEAMRQMIRDPSVLTSETDLSSKFNELIAKNTNYNAIVDARVNAIAKNVQATEKPLEMPDGSILKVKYKEIPGVIFDPVDMTLKVDKARVGKEGLTALSPGELEGLKSVLGAGQVFPGVSVEDAAQTMYENSLIAQSGLSITVGKTAAQIQKQLSDAEVSRVKAEYAEKNAELGIKKDELDIKQKATSIANTAANTQRTLQEIAQRNLTNPLEIQKLTKEISGASSKPAYSLRLSSFKDEKKDYGLGFNVPIETKLGGANVTVEGISVDANGTLYYLQTGKGGKKTLVPVSKADESGFINAMKDDKIRKDAMALLKNKPTSAANSSQPQPDPQPKGEKSAMVTNNSGDTMSEVDFLKMSPIERATWKTKKTGTPK